MVAVNIGFPVDAELDRLDVTGGDVLLLRMKGASKDDLTTMANRLGEALKARGLEGNVLILVIRDDLFDLSTLDEQEMAQHGWYRSVPASQR